MPLYFLMAKIDFVLTHMPRLSVSLSIFYRYFLILFLGTLIGCQQNVEYTYITGGGRCANGKQDPDEFGVDCGGACSQSCENLRYLEGEIFAKRILSKKRKKSLLFIGEIRKLYLTKKIELRKITVLFEVF